MKKSDLLFTVILLPLDYLMLILAGLITYYLRFRTLAELRPVIFEIPFFQYLKIVCIVSFIWLGIFVLNGLYQIGRQSFSQEFGKIFTSVTVGVMLITLFIFFKREYFSSRFIVLVGWLIAILFVSLGRLLLHFIRLQVFKHGLGLEPVLIVGSGQIAQNLIKYIEQEKGLGYKILDNLDSVEEVINQWANRAKKIGVLIQVDPNLPKDDVYRLVDFCNEHQITFKYVADTFGALLSNIKTETLAGIPLIEVRRTALDGWGRIFKRIFDIIISFIVLLFLLPFFLIIAILIKLDSPGPVFVALDRVGQRGKIFKLYKFRSMIKNAHQLKPSLLKYNERVGPLFKMKNDPRVTKIGRILRRWSIDELPQLVNVLKGEMSLVGPRPHEPEEVVQYRKEHKQLLTIKPGITGLAQISGRSEIPFDEEAKLDIYYIENWSFGFDLQILIKTIPVVLSRKNVA
jgi:exopolysaccharide biosynthesis polyprenyl glycosylphosphotransferase